VGVIPVGVVPVGVIPWALFPVGVIPGGRYSVLSLHFTLCMCICYSAYTSIIEITKSSVWYFYYLIQASVAGWVKIA
jgi:hypothetical protein